MTPKGDEVGQFKLVWYTEGLFYYTHRPPFPGLFRRKKNSWDPLSRFERSLPDRKSLEDGPCKYKRRVRGHRNLLRRR